MKFCQKAFLFTRTFFDFDDKTLNFIVRDDSSVFGFNIPYEEILTARSHQTVNEAWIELVGYIGVAYAWIDWNFIDRPAGNAPSLLVIIIAVISLALSVAGRFWFRSDATFINTPLGRIVILGDDQHDRIVKEIFERRKKALRGLLGTVNPLNYPQEEIERFRWLRDENLISAEEFNSAYAEITSRQVQSESTS